MWKNSWNENLLKKIIKNKIIIIEDDTKIRLKNYDKDEKKSRTNHRKK